METINTRIKKYGKVPVMNQILGFCYNYIKQNGRGPYMREINEGLHRYSAMDKKYIHKVTSKLVSMNILGRIECPSNTRGKLIRYFVLIGPEILERKDL